MSILFVEELLLINSINTLHQLLLNSILRGPGGLHQNSLEIDFIVVSGRRE